MSSCKNLSYTGPVVKKERAIYLLMVVVLMIVITGDSAGYET